MIPARRVYILLVLGIAIAPIIATVSNVPFSILVTLLFDAIVIGLMIIDSLLVRRHRVEITRQLQPRLSIGRDNPVTLSVKTGKKAKLQICDRYPIQFEVSTPVLKSSPSVGGTPTVVLKSWRSDGGTPSVKTPPLFAKSRRLSAILSQTLSANTSQDLTYTVHPNQRGEFAWGDIQVRQLGEWGLGWDDWKISQTQKIKVYPDLVGLRSLSIRLTLQSAGSIRKSRQRGIGTEFAELREYGTGDDLRLIDWKATARRNRPLVRVLEPEHEQTLIILLDRGRLMTAQVSGLKRFDWGLNATLALALAGINRGDRVGVGVFDRQMHTWIRPERGQTQLNHLIDRLTPIQPVLLESDYLGAVTSVVQQQSRRALVVLITDIVDNTASAELLAALGRLTPRYLPFCVTLRDRLVDQLAHTSTDDVKATYSRAVALDLLSQRQVAFAQLKQKGVLVLDAPADRITDQLVDRYLQLKARNQL